MVKRLLGVFNKEIHGLEAVAFLISFFVFLSQLLGLLRDRALAHYLGTSRALDIYYAAFRVPDFLFVSLASLVSINVLIPFFLSCLEKSKPEAHRFMNNIFTAFLIIMIAVSAIVFIIVPILAPLIAPGFNSIEQGELINLIRIMMLSPILMGLSNLFGTVTQIFRKFFVYALSPVFYNLGIVIGVLVFYPLWGLNGLALGVVLGALFHFLIQVPAVVKSGFLPHFVRNINWLEIKEVILVSVPRALGLALNSFALLVIVAIASTLSSGSISIFNFAKNLQAVPLGLIGIAFSVAAFPTLSRLSAQQAGLANEEHLQKFTKHFETAARQIIFWALPASFLFIVLRAQIVRVILGSGQFSWSDTQLTAASVAIFSVSILAQSLLLLTVRSFYAAGETRRPLIVNVISTGIIIVLSFVFLKIFHESSAIQEFFESLLRVRGLTGTEVLVLPLAYSLGTIINALWLLFVFRKNFLKTGKSFLRVIFFQIFMVSLVGALVTYIGLNVFSRVFDLSTFSGVFWQGLVSGILGIAAGMAVLRYTGNPELKAVVRVLKTRFSKLSPFGPSSEEL